MNENTEQEKIEEIIIAKNEEVIDLNKLDLNQLISRIGQLSLNHNPYSVSKEVENIKSIFYQKLKTEPKIDGLSNLKADDTVKELHPLEVKFKEVFGNYREIKSNFRKDRQEEEQKNLKIKLQIIEDIDSLTKEEESIKKTFEQFKTLQDKWKNIGYVPASHNNNLWQSYHHHVELFYDFIKLNNDLRDLDFTRNLEEKISICEKAEALINENSLNKMHDSLQELHEHWKNVGPVKRELREEIWERFQNISRTLNKKRNDYFTLRKEEEKRKLATKNEICKKIENLTKDSPNSHNKWQSLTSKCNELEVEWKNLGRLNKADNKIAWSNLRSSLNDFYQKKNVFYKNQKSKNNKALEIKVGICEEAEALQNETDWKETTNKLITLQKKWNTAGYSSKQQSDKIWKRFKEACDTFFNARKAYFKILDKEKAKNLKDKKELIIELKKITSTKDKKTDIKSLKEFSERWEAIGHVPRNKIDINDHFFSLINSKYKEIGLNKNELEKEKYKNKISSFKGNKKVINGEKQILKDKINLIKKDIAQYKNNMSFLGKNKGTIPLVNQVLQEIEKSNHEIEAIKQKLKILKG